MATATKTKATPTVFHRSSFTERLVFMSKPDRVTRLALRSAGFRWNTGGGYWWRNHSAMEAIKPADLAAILTPVNDDSGEVTEPATA